MRFIVAAWVSGIAVATPAALPAQSVPNLTGTWVMQLDQSDFGMVPGPLSRTDVIDHQEPKLTIKRSTTSAQGETNSTLIYVVDGKPYKNMVASNEITSMLRWDGATLVSVSTTSTGQGEVTITDRFTLSADGQTLTQARSFSIGGQELGQTIVLAKKPPPP